MPPTIADILGCWGKAQPADPLPYPQWHPVAYHLLDVAAVADALLTARPLALARAARLLALEPDKARQLLVALVALHDLGKFAPAFQAKVPELWPTAVLGEFDPTRVRDTRHTDDGHVLWERRLEALAAERLWPDGTEAMRALAPGIFGHHGRPVGGDSIVPLVEQQFGARGAEAAMACAEVVLALLAPRPLGAPALSDEQARLASWWVAGLTTIADWVGSSQAWFPYTAALPDDPTLAAYWELARTRARSAVAEAGLVPPPPAPAKTFVDLTGRDEPTPAQRWAAAVPLPPGPLLVIVEDVTGAGKTEAAQMLVHRLMAAGRAAGAYWAMPTQATANAMYARQAGALDALYDATGETKPSLVLAHGQQRLHERFRASVLGSASSGPEARGSRGGDDPELPATAACAAFLADNRRAALLADVGAGTVDQALLGVLPSRFNTLRLFGLADKVLVVDEAHAYDAYMGVEAQELLRFHAALGGCAVVLSATLSRKQRESMACAWAEGVDGGRRRAGHANPEALTPLTRSEAYPLATLVADGSPFVREDPLEAAAWSHRTVGVRLVHDVDEVLEHALGVAARGGAVAWVRNTVDDCLEAAARLRVRGVEPLVFHARFAQADRQRREQEVLALFGPEAPARARRGRILVATQVVEQSLDLDFDAMVSDVAPVDLLVQRAGRLWRHPDRAAGRPSGLPCELVVLSPPPVDDPPPDWLGGVFRGTGHVYDDAGVLWRTVRALARAGAIETPHGLRALIGAVYDSVEVPDALLAAAKRAHGKQSGHAAAATYATLKVTDGYDASAHAWVSDLRAVTRVGDEQTVVRLARVRPDGALEPWADDDGPPWKRWALSEVRVSATRVPFGSTAEPRHAEAVAKVRAEWGRFEQEIPVLPLTPAPSAAWEGSLMAPQGGRMRRVRYSETDGLIYPADDG